MLNKEMISDSELVRLVRQGHVAWTCSAIRRLVEDPKPRNPPTDPKKDPKLVISLVLLLRDVQNHARIFTRERQRFMYIKSNPAFAADQFREVADRDFNKVAKNKRAKALSPNRIEKDIQALKRATRKIQRHVDKNIAHHERHRRRLGRPAVIGEIDRAINLLFGDFHRYHLLITGREPDDAVVGDDVRPELMRLFPDAERPKEWPV